MVFFGRVFMTSRQWYSNIKSDIITIFPKIDENVYDNAYRYFLSFFLFFYHLKENDVLDEVVLVFELGLLYIKIGFLMFLYLV